MDRECSLEDLYDWTTRWQDELEELKNAFPEPLKADRNRLVASLSCLRVSIEVRIKHKPMKKPDVPPTDVGLHKPSERLSRLYRGGPDGTGTPPVGRL